MSGRRPRVAVVTFPGSLDDRDALRAVATMGGEPVSVWHGDTELHGADAAILPGGFSYGDYLRTGAIARFAPAMRAVSSLADAGGPVLGICNGFQILCEAGLLPGALIRNRQLSFVCRWVNVRVEGGRGDGAIGRAGDVLPIPIKHGEGQFVASSDELDRLERDGRVALRYCSPAGEVSDAYNPNGAARNIAGVWNAGRNVLGLMPHPEHAVDPDLGPTGGQAILGWLLAAARDRVPA
jgi:phosphoribosylformylglycinamidine synthase I